MASEISTLFIRVSAELDQSLKDLEKQFGGLQRSAQKLSSAGAALTKGLTVPIVGLGTAAVVSAVKFESAMAGVAKTLDETGLSGEEVNAWLEDFGDELQALSEVIPVSSKELAGIAETASQLGVKRDDLLQFTRAMADLGVASKDLSADEAATSLARFTNITGLGIDKIKNLSSAVVYAGNRFATTEREIVEFGQRIAGAGTIAGLTEPQILAIGAAAASIGVEAEAGSTSFQKVILEMVDSVNSGGRHLELFAATAGVSAEEFSRVYREDAAKAFTIFVEGLGREGQNATNVLKALGLSNERVRRLFLGLAGAGELTRDAIREISEAYEVGEAADIEAAKRYATTASQLTMLKNALENAAEELGGNLTQMIKDAVPHIKRFLGLLSDLVKGFTNLPGFVKTSAVVIAGLFAIIGPALWMLGSMASGLMSIHVASVLLGKSGPVAGAGLASIGVGARAMFAGIVAGLPILLTAIAAIELLRAATKDVEAPGDARQQAIGGGFQGIGNLQQSMKDASDQVARARGEMADFTKVVSGSSSAVAGLVDVEEVLARTQEELAEQARQAQEELEKLLAGEDKASRATKGRAEALTGLIERLSTAAATAGEGARAELEYQLGTLGATDAIKAQALALFDITEAKGKNAQLTEEATAQAEAWNKQLKEITKRLDLEMKAVKAGNKELQKYELILQGATDAEAEAIIEKRRHIIFLENLEQVQRDTARAIHDETARIKDDAQSLGRVFIDVANEITDGFAGRLERAFKGLGDIVGRVFGDRGSGLMAKVGGFASNLLTMAGPAGAIAAGVNEIGKLFGVDLVGMIGAALEKLGHVVREGFGKILDIFRDTPKLFGSEGGVSERERILSKTILENAGVYEDVLKALADLPFDERDKTIVDLVARGFREGIQTPEEWAEFFNARIREIEDIPRIAAAFGLDASGVVGDLLRSMMAEGLSTAEIFSELATLVDAQAATNLSLEDFFSREIARREAKREAFALATEFGLGEVEAAQKLIENLLISGAAQEAIWAELGELIKKAARLGFDTDAELEAFFAERIPPIDLDAWSPRTGAGLPGMGVSGASGAGFGFGRIASAAISLEVPLYLDSREIGRAIEPDLMQRLLTEMGLPNS